MLGLDDRHDGQTAQAATANMIGHGAKQHKLPTAHFTVERLRVHRPEPVREGTDNVENRATTADT